MTLLLIRHAQSVNNSLPEEQRSADPGLTDLGQQQAILLADRLADWGPTRLITSAFRRSLETTSWVALATRLVPQVRVELHEQGGCQAGAEPASYQGQPGLTREEILAEYGDWDLDPRIDETGWWKCRAWERPAEAEERARVVAATLLEEIADSDQRVAVVTHGMFLPILVSALLHRPFVGAEWLGVLYNTAACQLSLSAGQARLESYNDASHLPADARTT